MQNITFKVTGMSCNHCVKTIQESVGRLAGVEEVEVDLKSGEVQVDFDAEKVAAVEIKKEIEEQGYDAEQIVPFF
ncbi:copper chaperone CopZ [Heyndrickxia acidicola]|uniref:Copper chaperone CopZ n=1 Tax=Heyndrickxia acidicola TaxID=209389 RepID=A0ABU6MGK8_9BACI|nr:copper chaperone CopZ [Heyndrickxia acidicola]MED1203815.1 copper chaperone CopZ [Heyndrickxia acidicola]